MYIVFFVFFGGEGGNVCYLIEHYLTDILPPHSKTTTMSWPLFSGMYWVFCSTIYFII